MQEKQPIDVEVKETTLEDRVSNLEAMVQALSATVLSVVMPGIIEQNTGLNQLKQQVMGQDAKIATIETGSKKKGLFGGKTGSVSVHDTVTGVTYVSQSAAAKAVAGSLGLDSTDKFVYYKIVSLEPERFRPATEQEAAVAIAEQEAITAANIARAEAEEGIAAIKAGLELGGKATEGTPLINKDKPSIMKEIPIVPKEAGAVLKDAAAALGETVGVPKVHNKPADSVPSTKSPFQGVPIVKGATPASMQDEKTEGKDKTGKSKS